MKTSALEHRTNLDVGVADFHASPNCPVTVGQRVRHVQGIHFVGTVVAVDEKYRCVRIEPEGRRREAELWVVWDMVEPVRSKR